MVVLALGLLAITIAFLLFQKRSNAAESGGQAGRHLTESKSSWTDTNDLDRREQDQSDKTDPGLVPKMTINGTAAAPSRRDPFSIDESKSKTSGLAVSDAAPKATNTSMPAPSLMLPPARPTTKQAPLRAPPKLSSTLRPPPSAASTQRAPPGASLAPPVASLAPSISTLAPSKRPSRKVLLEPGHSPLDWAHLIAKPPTPTFLRGDDVPPQLIKVPPSLLKYHNGRKDKTSGKRRDAWGVYQGKVYNMTPYLDFHPGGQDQLMRGAGKDNAEKLFNEVHPWVSWENMLGECLVGILVSENEITADAVNGSEMDDMD